MHMIIEFHFNDRKAITLDDVKQFARTMYTRANLTLGINGDAPEAMVRALRSALGTLPQGPAAPRLAPVTNATCGPCKLSSLMSWPPAESDRGKPAALHRRVQPTLHR